MNDEERDAFEAWMMRPEFNTRSDSGKYESSHVDAMWSAWQARASAKSEPAEGAMETLIAVARYLGIVARDRERGGQAEAYHRRVRAHHCRATEDRRAEGRLLAGTGGSSPRQPFDLGYELDGVIADVEQGDGFDAVCLETIKRVRAALAEQARPIEREGWQLVPKEPEEQWFWRVADKMREHTGPNSQPASWFLTDAKRFHRAMLAAAPQPQEPSEAPAGEQP